MRDELHLEDHLAPCAVRGQRSGRPARWLQVSGGLGGRQWDALQALAGEGSDLVGPVGDVEQVAALVDPSDLLGVVGSQLLRQAALGGGDEERGLRDCVALHHVLVACRLLGLLEHVLDLLTLGMLSRGRAGRVAASQSAERPGGLLSGSRRSKRG